MATFRIAGGQVLRPNGSVERADVVVNADSGTIEAVEGPGDPPTGSDLDARDALVMPGLVNAHTHVAMTLFRGYSDDKPVDAWLEEDIWPAEAELTRADIEAGAALGMLEMIKTGTTAFADMYFEVDAIADVVEQSGLRARLGYGMVTAGIEEPASIRDELEHGLEVARNLQDRKTDHITAAYMPHALTTVDRDILADMLPAVREAGIPVHFHANESPAFVEPIVDETGERPLAVADRLGLLTEDDWLAHCVHLSDPEIELLAETGVGVAHCPASNMKLASGAAPIPALQNAGVPIGLGTDGAGSNNVLDLFHELRLAALLGKLAADDATAVPAAQAIEMATTGGAAVAGLPTGELTAGAPADLAVVDFSGPESHPRHDSVSHLAYATTGRAVRHTICDGEVLMEDREVHPFDEAAVKRRASERAADLVARAGS